MCFFLQQRKHSTELERYHACLLPLGLCLLFKVFSALCEDDDFLALLQGHEGLANSASDALWGLQAVFGLVETEKITVSNKVTHLNDD